jgi:hypothetical protein
MFLISGVLTKWLGLISVETEKTVFVFVVLFAVCLGGYYATRRGKPTGWPNALAVGILAELMVAGQLAKGTTLEERRQSLIEIMSNPGPNWRAFVQLVLTLPVAILGSGIWEMSSRLRKGESEKERQEERAGGTP